MIRIFLLISFLLLGQFVFGQVDASTQDAVSVSKHPPVLRTFIKPPFDATIHLRGYTIVMDNGDVHESNGQAWVQTVSGVSGSTDGKTLKGTGESGDEYKNGWSVDYESNVNGARFVENITTSNTVFFLTKNQDYANGDLIFARTSNTGTLRLNVETGETYTIQGLAFFTIPKLSDAIFQYDATRDNWSIVGGSVMTNITLAASNKMAKMVNASTPATDYNTATFTTFNQWDDTNAINDDPTGTYDVGTTFIRSRVLNINRFRLQANIHLTASAAGGKVRAEIFVDGVTTGRIFFSDESTLNSSDITVYIDEVIDIPFFDGVHIGLSRAGGAGTITTGSVGGSYFQMIKLK